MSMICNLRRVPPAELARVLDAPELIVSFLYGPNARPPQPAGWFGRLFGTKTPPAPPAAWAPRRDGDEIDIEKAWHGLHFMFTGTAWAGQGPAAFLAVGGRAIGGVDVGYGPARAFTPAEVREIAAYLRGWSEDALAQRYDPPRMTQLDIYPQIWEPGDDDEQLEYLMDAFRTLREFVGAADEAGDGLVVYIN